MVNRKAAPQQTVVSIDRKGQWGKVEYHHLLSCGHTEVRKRPSPAPKIACTWCVIAAEKSVELRALTIVPPPVSDEQTWDFYDDSISDEVSIASLRSSIAAKIGCSNENIEVVSTYDDDGQLRVNYVTIFLDHQQARNFANGGGDES